MIIAGGPWAQPANAPRSPASPTRWAGPSWPTRCRGAASDGAIAAADAIVRTEPPLPECVVLLGLPWLSRALGDIRLPGRGAGARIIAVDPLRQWADPLRVATEFHQCDVDRWLDAAVASAAPADPQWLDSWRERKPRPRVPSPMSSGPTSASRWSPAPSIATQPRRAPRSSWRPPCRSATSSGTPSRSPVAAPSAGQPGRERDRRRRVDGPGSRRRQGRAGTRTIALLGDLTFLHDVSGSGQPAGVRCTFVVLDNGGGGIFSFLPQATSRRAGECSSRLFGTPPTQRHRRGGARIRTSGARSRSAVAA